MDMPRSAVKKIAFLTVGIAGFPAAYYAVRTVMSPAPEIPVVAVERGELLLSLVVNGHLEARQASVLTAPRVRNLQVTWLAPEGSRVKTGDPVIRFDSTRQLAELQDRQSALEIAETQLERAEKELAVQEKQLALELLQARRNYDEMKYEAPRLADEAKFKLELAELNQQAKFKQQRADVSKATLEVQRARDQVTLSQHELEQMTLTAPIPAMVVYLDITTATSTNKVQAGDTPYAGQPLVALPDLSEMVMKAASSEVDASAIASGQEAIVSVDAFPDKTYRARVTSKGTLAHRRDRDSKINVFDVELVLLDTDPELRPGMSASAEIHVDRLEDAVSVPLEALFEKAGKPRVYLADGSPRDVEVGRRNDRKIEVVTGLSGGERIRLIDPSSEREEPRGSGEPPEKASHLEALAHRPALAGVVAGAAADTVASALAGKTGPGPSVQPAPAGKDRLDPNAEPTPAGAARPAPSTQRVPDDEAREPGRNAVAPATSALAGKLENFRVQAFASRSRAAAARVRTDLAARFGLLVELEFEDPYYKVRVDCSSRTDCQELQANLRAAGYTTAFVVPARNGAP
jgi:HlyD family secretion protein